MKMKTTTLSLAAAALAIGFFSGSAVAGPKEDALAKCKAAHPEIPAAELQVSDDLHCHRTVAVALNGATPTTSAAAEPEPTSVATAPAATPEPTAPRTLKVDGKPVKVWGVPTSQHFTKNNLFDNFWGKCPTGMVFAETVTNPAILAKYKDPNVDYLYHFVCLDNPPA